MATMNIKDPAVRDMAMALARRRGTSATAAVRQALAEALERDAEASRLGLAERLMAIGAQAQQRSGGYLTDTDLYDESGLPR